MFVLLKLPQKPHVVFVKEADVVFEAKVISEPMVLISNFWPTRNRSESLTCLGIVTSNRFERTIGFISVRIHSDFASGRMSSKWVSQCSNSSL